MDDFSNRKSARLISCTLLGGVLGAALAILFLLAGGGGVIAMGIYFCTAAFGLIIGVLCNVAPWPFSNADRS